MRFYYKDNKGGLFNLKSEDFIKYKEVEEIFTLKDKEDNALLDENGVAITETIVRKIPDGLIDGYTQITEAEFNELAKPPEPTEEQKAAQAKQKLIAEKKALLNKYREDVEQVDLFGMERADYAEKKLACKTLVEELRVLENNQTTG